MTLNTDKGSSSPVWLTIFRCSMGLDPGLLSGSHRWFQDCALSSGLTHTPTDSQFRCLDLPILLLKDKIVTGHTLEVEAGIQWKWNAPLPTALCCVEGFGNDGPPIHQWSVARPSANQKARWFVPTNESRRNPCSSYTSVVSGCFIRAHILNPQ